MNTLYSTGQVVQIAVGESYTVKDDEVFVNSHLYKKRDLEIQISGDHDSADAKDVFVGIRLRSGFKGVPAHSKKYLKWNIDTVQITSLSELVEKINTSLQ